MGKSALVDEIYKIINIPITELWQSRAWQWDDYHMSAPDASAILRKAYRLNRFVCTPRAPMLEATKRQLGEALHLPPSRPPLATRARQRLNAQKQTLLTLRPTSENSG
eukprot:1179248-Prorocentrum_minimum.AAC.4